jgi:multidrug efflux pump subunit AcrA (membrane-fusion protein)
MANSFSKGYFPSQVASDQEKVSLEYGLKVAKAIEDEWFKRDNSGYRFSSHQNSFDKLRLYARGEQSIQKYKNELSINGDLSYLNLDWTPVPIISKFVDIVVNGISERTYDIKAYSQDPYGVSKRTKYMDGIIRDLKTKELNEFAEEAFGVNLFTTSPSKLPDSEEELALHMQLSYKQAVELAEEQAINTLLDGNRYELTKKRFYYDITVLGIGAVKCTFDTSRGVAVEYVDPANLVYSHTDSPYFDDIYYVGEVKTIPINELVKQFPNLKQEDLEEITSQSFHKHGYYNRNGSGTDEPDKNQVQILYFNYKTYANEVYKVKETATGATKVIIKDDTFNPAQDQMLEAKYGKMSRSIEVLYEGALILGSEKLLKWELAKNMMRPKSDFTKVKMNYSIVAPRMYKGKIESLVGRITGFADMIQLTHLKLQQVMSRMVPDGIYLDADGLAEIDLGNGTNYNPQEALNMFFQTGSIIGRSMTSDGDMNPGKVPIQEISSGSGGQKMQVLIQTYNYYLQMIRDVTGLNEARDASTPDAKALVGIQKLAAANSNTATRHILQAGLFLTSEMAECLSLRISDIIEYSPTRDAFIQSIGTHNVATLDEMKDLHLYDFGIFIELQPDDEERAMLENNIQQALQQQLIELSDAIDLREIKNVKLANQLLKVKRKKKLERDQKVQQENIQAQSQANIQAQQASAQMEMQKNQAMAQTTIQIEQAKSEMSKAMLQAEAMIKKQLMDHEFQLNMQLKQMELNSVKAKDTQKEDRKDDRTKIQASQQSELIDQRAKSSPPKNFESKGNDTLGGGFDLGSFEPR